MQWRVGVLGASSLVGECLLPLLADADWQVVAYSRGAPGHGVDGVEWRQLPLAESPSPQPSPQRGEGVTSHWICVAPIWVLPNYFSLIEAAGARRIAVLSSTSRFTKVGSGDTAENAIAVRLIDGEASVREWAASRGIEWVILRPTLIYGYGRDKNIAEIARWVRRFGFFPLLGKALGLRQPVHADDVAAACVAALLSPVAGNSAYNLSGGETLAYREMVERIFAAMNRRARLVTIPLSVFRLVIGCLRWLPRYQHWSAAMAERMNRDLVFEHSDAARDLNFSPRPFQLSAEDLPT
ncbi:epimerase [Rugosibacter aromaticivorans]|uniref:Epimerase n=1 Tax=Rugosibacter aromaticivorans TaxID=1565605 RepID=A0A0C5JA14_9PROT|nr:epimerase [Rugosibacter aromaticivorans]